MQISIKLDEISPLQAIQNMQTLVYYLPVLETDILQSISHKNIWKKQVALRFEIKSRIILIPADLEYLSNSSLSSFIVKDGISGKKN